MEIPDKIESCTLSCVCMPNGEVLSNGKSIGWVHDFGKFLQIEETIKIRYYLS
jgi:hypothetical protein